MSVTGWAPPNRSELVKPNGLANMVQGEGYDTLSLCIHIVSLHVVMTDFGVSRNQCLTAMFDLENRTITWCQGLDCVMHVLFKTHY